MKEKNLHKIIDLYFDAQLSGSEEEELFRSLLAFKGEDEKVKEALAVMLMARSPSMMDTQRMHSVRNPLIERRNSRFRILKRAVAAALVIISCSAALLYYSHHNAGVEIEGMIAYIGGVKVSDHSEIMKIVDDQLNDINASSELFSQTVSSDLDDIRNAFNEEGI